MFLFQLSFTLAHELLVTQIIWPPQFNIRRNISKHKIAYTLKSEFISLSLLVLINDICNFVYAFY